MCIDVFGVSDCRKIDDPEMEHLGRLALDAAIALDNIIIGNENFEPDWNKNAIRKLGEYLTLVDKDTDPRILRALKGAIEASNVTQRIGMEDIAPFMPAVIAANLVPYAFQVIGADGNKIGEDYVRTFSSSSKEEVESLALSFATRDYGESTTVESIIAVDEKYVRNLIPNIKRG